LVSPLGKNAFATWMLPHLDVRGKGRVHLSCDADAGRLSNIADNFNKYGLTDPVRPMFAMH